MADESSKVEFNSNLAVLIRCNRIIDAINESRFRTTMKDNYGNPLADAEEYLSHIIALYMEISVELTNKEDDVWNRLVILRDKLRMNPPKPRIESMSYWKKTIGEIDDLSRDIRRLAKAHGFLSTNKKDIRRSVLRS